MNYQAWARHQPRTNASTLETYTLEKPEYHFDQRFSGRSRHISLPTCRVSDVQLTRISYPLLAARGLLRQFVQEHRDGHQAS